MNIAILIDAENVLPSHADMIFSHAASLGNVARREIYGAAQALTSWVAPVLKYAIHPNLTIRASKGKNSSDIALVIGAMDLLAAGGIDTVIIASSDSDFSALSVRLRNAGIEVIGMGVDKSNELWRTACSSFVTLQLPSKQAAKPAQAQKQPAQPAKQPTQPAKQAPAKQQPQKQPAQPAKQPAPAKQEATPAKQPAPAAETHAERQAIITRFIRDQLESAGGSLQTNALFTALNALPEYRVDQQRSRRRPLNYLIRQYGDAFHFEDGADGNGLVTFAEAAPQSAEAEPQTPATEAEPAPAQEIDTPAAVEADASAAVEAADIPAAAEEADAADVSAISEEADTAADANAEEADTSDVPANAEEADVADDSDPLALLMDAGLTQDVAGQIVAIFTESADLRSAYNQLRKTFGNTAGREYYQLVKQIAGSRG